MGAPFFAERRVRCFHPAVHEAYAEIQVSWNAVPDGQWFAQLYGAQISITHMLHELEGGREA